MTIFAQITDGRVTTVFPAAQDPELWPDLVEMREDDPLYLDFLASFTASDEEVALRERDEKLALAALRIAPLQDAVDLGEATAEENADLITWKRYRVDLNRLPEQAGYPSAIDWPVPPA